MAKNRKYKNKAKAAKVKSMMAELADKYMLYEQAVQCVEAEADFVDKTFKRLRGRSPRTLREDFCGTMNSSCEWVRRRHNTIAYAVDIDPGVLDWGRDHHLSELTADQVKRLHIFNTDVMQADVPPTDAVVAMNFSYWIFKDRANMKHYFDRIYRGLNKDGVLFLDAFGGYEAFQEMQESTKYNGFTYIWEQAHYNPITGDATLYIHFKFKDGSRIKKAFTYHWRMWTLPELTELLQEAGFKASVYWEGTDKDGEGNGVFTPTTKGEADAGWIAYIVAAK
ncbi:MAG: class I SAM-dependent methyltransferase [Gammaproteobacteria bacterium]